MVSLSLLGRILLVVYSLCGAALSSRLPVDEIFRKELQKKDLDCREDDALLSFQEYTQDSVPFCSNYLSIGVSTTTVPVTDRTTLTTTTTVTTGVEVDATTIQTGTATVTTTAGLVDKRQFITPASVLIEACTLSPQNQSLISIVSSACSCLTITPSLVDQSATVTSTRIITEVDYRLGTISGTVFGMITTTVAVLPSRANATTVPASSVIGPSSTSISSITATISSPSNSVAFKSPLPISSAFSGSPTTLGTAISSGPPIVSINSTAPVSSISLGPPVSSSATAVVSSSASSAVSELSTSTRSTTNTPPIVPTSGSLIPAPITSGSPSVAPKESTNSTTPTSVVSSDAPPGISVSSSKISTGSSNITTPTSTSTGSSTSSLPSLGGVCPFENGTHYTTRGQTFLIECYINFPGPSSEGLDEPDLYACINECAQVNLGFSQDNCFAASYFPNTIDNQNCFLRDKQDSLNPYTDYFTIGAILIGGLSNVTTNTTSGVLPTVSSSGSIAISISSTNPPILPPSINTTPLTPVTSSMSIGTSSAPSGIPNNPANSSSPTIPPLTQSSTTSSGFSTISSNSSSIRFLTSSASSGLPTISANSSSSAGVLTSTPSGLPTTSSNSTSFGGSSSSGIPTISSNSTVIRTPSGSPMSSPTGSVTILSNSSAPTVPPFTPPIASYRSGLQSSATSGFPSPSANVTSVPPVSSGFPTKSLNISSSPSLVIPVASDNKTTGLHTSTQKINSTPSGFPTIASNATTLPSGQPTNPLSRNASFTTGPQNCTGCAPTQVITSYFTTIWTTTITSTSETIMTREAAKKAARSLPTKALRFEWRAPV